MWRLSWLWFYSLKQLIHAELEKSLHTGKQQALSKWAFIALPKQYKAAHKPHLNDKGEVRMTASSVEGWRGFWKGKNSSPSSLSLEERNVFLETVGPTSKPNHKYLVSEYIAFSAISCDEQNAQETGRKAPNTAKVTMVSAWFTAQEGLHDVCRVSENHLKCCRVAALSY